MTASQVTNTDNSSQEIKTYCDEHFAKLANQLNLQNTRLVVSEINNKRRLDQHEREIAALTNRRVVAITNLANGSGKIILKLGAKEVVYQIAKQFSIQIAERAVTITGAKIIPIVSIVFGVGLAIHRVYRGYSTDDKTEYVKAIGEVSSGIFACFPIWGTGASVALDLAMVGHDVYRYFNFSPNANDSIRNDETTLVDAYKGLNLNPNMELSKDNVDTAYRNFSKSLHPDVDASSSSQEQQDDLNVLMQFINRCKDVIYREHGWNGEPNNEE